MIKQLRKHAPIKVLIQDVAENTIDRQPVDVLPKSGQLFFQASIAALPDSAPDVVREKAMGVDSATFGNAIDLKRPPKRFHWPNEGIEIRRRLDSTRNVNKPYPFIVTDEHVVGMIFGSHKGARSI